MGRGSDARQRLIAAAAELICARSYADTGVQALCRHAGVGKGSFYHFFASKEALTVAAIEAHWEQDRKMLAPECSGGSALDCIRQLVLHYAAMQKAHTSKDGQVPGCRFGNLAVELGGRNPAVNAALGRVFAMQVDAFERLLQEAVAQGERPPGDTRSSAEALLALVQGALVLAKLRNDPQVIERLADHAVGLAAMQTGDKVRNRI